MKDKYKVLQVLIHILVWGGVFCFPLFFTGRNSEAMTLERYLGYVGVPITFFVVFYLNYFVLIDRILFRKKLVQFVLINIVLFVVMTLSLHVWQNYHYLHFVKKAGETIHQGPPRALFIIRDGMMMVLLAGLSVAIRMTGNWYIVENEKKELEKARSEAELQNLKSQLNPHFLFNTLNNIYSLIAIDPDRAQYAVHDLSRLLRHVLYEDNQRLVSLDNELVFMKSYIELMGLRLPDRVDLKVDMPEDKTGILIAPLLFISLIENAFKHGVSPTEPSFIHINLRVERHNRIKCLIENSYFPKKDSDRSGSGIGLENLRKRLGLLYPGQFLLRTGLMGEVYVSELDLDIK